MESSEVLLTLAECGCCGMREECTLDYIKHVKARFHGVWVCGLCAEAVKDEQARLGLEIDAALIVHAKFREIANVEPSIDIAQSLLRLLKRIISTSSDAPSPD